MSVAAHTTHLRHGYWGISMWTHAGMTPHEIASAIAPITGVYKGKLRWTRVGALRAAGFAIADLRSDGHFNLRVATRPNRQTWETLDALLSEPERFEVGNPKGVGTE